MHTNYKYRACGLMSAFLLGVAGAQSCTPAALNNLNPPTVDFTAPTGLPVPRTIQVGFINNTPFRAIFTFGAYDPLDKDTLPTGFGQARLEGNTASAQQPQPCRKVFSVGDDEL